MDPDAEAAPPRQPSWPPSSGRRRSTLAEPAPARSRLPAGHGPGLLPPTQQRAGRRPGQRRGQAHRGAGQPARRRPDPHRPARDRHPHGSGLATGDRNVPGHARLRLRPDYRGGRAGRGPDGLAPGNPAAGGQHPHGPRSLFAAGNQQPGAARLLCRPQGVPGAPRPVWRRPAGQRPLGPDPRATRAAPPAAAAAHPNGPARAPAAATVEARTLQASALRRIWSTLLDHRDWVSYVYVPLLVPLLFLLPYLVVKSYQRSHRLNQLIDSLSQGSRDLEIMSQLLDGVRPLDRRGGRRRFAASTSRTSRVSRSSRTRASSICETGTRARRGRAIRAFPGLCLSAIEGRQTARERGQPPCSAFAFCRPVPRRRCGFPAQLLRPRLRMSDVESTVVGQEECRWEVSYDFQRRSRRRIRRSHHRRALPRRVSGRWTRCDPCFLSTSRPIRPS